LIFRNEDEVTTPQGASAAEWRELAIVELCEGNYHHRVSKANESQTGRHRLCNN
jgi:hypothetical protein